METSPNITLPYIMPSQAQKHVTHNEAIRMLDSLVQLAVVSASLSTPPIAPDEGTRYIVADNAVGAWQGHEQKLAAYADGAWLFFPPKEGWLVWDTETATSLIYADSLWGLYADKLLTSVENAQINNLGVNTGPDPNNALSVRGNASLFTHNGSDHRVSINKVAGSATASVLFQTAWGGRAEFGLIGSDDFSIKTSEDGSNWLTALQVNKTSGEVDFPEGVLSRGSKAGLDLNVNAGLELTGYTNTTTTLARVTDNASITATRSDTSLLITMVLSGVIRATAGGDDALALIKPGYEKGGTITETFRDHLIGALDTQGSAPTSTNAFYLASPASFILTPAMKDGNEWKPLFLGRCNAAGMFLQCFGFSWSAIEFRN